MKKNDALIIPQAEPPATGPMRRVEMIQLKLTEQQLKEHKEELVRNAIELGEKETQLDDIKEKFKSEMNPLKKRNARLLNEINQGFMMVEMEVELKPDYSTGLVELIDPDTGEVLHVREMLPEDRQFII